MYKSVVKSVLTCGAETWSLYKDDRRGIDGTETDVLRGSARISKLDRKTNGYTGEKMNKQDTILEEITRKQLIWCGHVERMDRTRLPKIMINWKPEWKQKARPPPKNLERWDMYRRD